MAATWIHPVAGPRVVLADLSASIIALTAGGWRGAAGRTAAIWRAGGLASGTVAMSSRRTAAIGVCDRSRAMIVLTKRLRLSRQGASIAAAHMNVRQASPPRIVRNPSTR